MGSEREQGSMRGCFLPLLLLLLLNNFSATSGGIVCSDCSNPKDGSSTTGISDQSTDGIGTSLPSPCPTRWHCKRPSLKNQRKLICCLRVLRHGRFKCPNSCD